MVNRWCLVVTLHPIKLPISKEWPVRKLTLQISQKKIKPHQPIPPFTYIPKKAPWSGHKGTNIHPHRANLCRPSWFETASHWNGVLLFFGNEETKDSWNHLPIFLVEIVGKTVKVRQQQLENLGDSMHKQTKSAILSIGVHFPQSQCFYELCKISQDHYTTKRIHKDLSQPSPKASMLGLASMWSRNS